MAQYRQISILDKKSSYKQWTKVRKGPYSMGQIDYNTIWPGLSRLIHSDKYFV